MTKETVLITGASNGLGEYLAYTFGQKYDLILNGRSKKDLERVASKLKTKPIIIRGDIRRKATIEKLYKAAGETNMSVLINNAGLPCLNTSLEDMTEKYIYDLISTILIAPIKLTQKLYPLFIKRNNGRIINMNSIIALEGKIKKSISTATKNGLAGF